MMPVVRLSDATFDDLTSIAKWLGTKTPPETIDHLVKEAMDSLGMEHDDGEAVASPQGDHRVFENAPGLSFTRILSASVNHQKPEKMTWGGLLRSVIKLVHAKGLNGQHLVQELQIHAKASKYEEDGFRFYPDLGISIQGQSAADAWKEVRRLADRHHIPVEVTFQWRENEKAQQPGKIGVIRAGK